MLHQHPSSVATLCPHPASAWAPDIHLTAHAAWRSQDTLVLDFVLSGPGMAQLRVPPAGPPGPADGLWQHTCLEAFIGRAADPGYREYNFSPSGQWALYPFSAERVRDRAAEPAVPDAGWPMVWTTGEQRLQLQVELTLADWPDRPHARDPATDWQLGLSAVLEHTDGRLSYWALHHPRAQPDFHHPAGRVLRLAPPMH